MTDPTPDQPLDPSRARIVVNDIFARPTHKPPHPLAIPRVSAALDLAGALGWLEPHRVIRSETATRAEVLAFHDPAYLDCLERAERDQRVTPDEAARFGLGIEGNGLYPDVFRRPMIAAGGTLLACRTALAHRIAVHHPGGGTHHARPARASGFCYLNDAVLGLLAWLEAGLTRLVYLDIDAHHGDGVEQAFAQDPRVLTISTHEAGRWPRTGTLDEEGLAAAINLPLPAGLNDTEMRHVADRAIFPAIDAHRPQAAILQCGADALLEDPQSRLALSNNAHLDICARLLWRGVPLVVLGGGGYNPFTVARLWAAIWGRLSGRDLDTPLPEAAARSLAATDWHLAHRRPPDPALFATLRDRPREGPIRAEIRSIADRARRRMSA